MTRIPVRNGSRAASARPLSPAAPPPSARAALLLLAFLLPACGRSPAPEPRPLSERAADFDAAWDRMDLGEPEEALAVFDALIREEPLDALAHVGRGEALLRTDRPAEASVAFRQALALDSAVPLAARGLTVATAGLGRVDESLRWLSAALTLGQVTPDDIEQDPDLSPLRDDHRVLFFRTTGFLPTRDEELQAQAAAPTVAVGGEVVLYLRLLLLNRDFTADDAPPLLSLEHPLPPGFLLPLARVERVETGAAGERQYMVRTLELRFRALAAGSLLVGPFRLRLGELQLSAPAVRIRLGGGAAESIDDPDRVHIQRSALPDRPGLEPDPAGDFFVFPSALRGIPDEASLELRPVGGGRYLLRAQIPWRGTGMGFSGAVRVDGLEPAPPHTAPQVTMLLRRATLGKSLLRIEQSIEPGDRAVIGPLRLLDGEEELARAQWKLAD